MARIALVVLLALLLGPHRSGAADGGNAAPEEPQSVAIGALLALKTRIGRAARSAMQLAVREINEDDRLLRGVRLVLHIVDSNCTALHAAAAAVELMEKKVVAIAGPQTSESAHFVAHMATATQVPVVSFSATDPSLSESQFRYFIRMTHSDKIHVEAIADLVKMFEWKEVIALYSDDNFGTNGIGVLHDAIARTGSSIPLKAAVSSTMSDDHIGVVLARFSEMGGRIYVVHTGASVGRRVFTVAYNLRMLSTGYVWIVTEAISSVLDTIYLDEEFVEATQGVVGTRSFVPESPQLEKFRSNWNMFNYNRSKVFKNANVNQYGYYAYDTVWLIAYAIDKFISACNRGFTFGSLNRTFLDTDFGKLPVLMEGPDLLEYIRGTTFKGITGKVELDGGELCGSNLEIVNMVGKGLHVAGYWNKEKRFSVDPPLTDSLERLLSASRLQKKLHHVVWPGGGIHVPRGWMIPRTGRELLIGVPLKQGYKEFVDATVNSANISSFHGYCIDVFKAALSYLPYTVSYSFVPFGDGNATPSYDELVEKVANKEFDAAVGDITITQKRAKMVDFTQPYTLSGLVLVVPFMETHAHRAWAFLQPFSTTMWCITAAFFLLTGLVVWLLEHPKNIEFRGRLSKQIGTSLWFIFSTLFFSQRENVKSTCGRIVVLIWLFVVLILISSYTASFTSILTVRKLKPTIHGLSMLVDSGVKIGYQEGSFVKDYLEHLSIYGERLVALNSLSSYSSALAEENGIGAVVDELPYMQLLLSSNCKLAITGEEEFSKSGWGFAFPKGSPLSVDISTAILTLAESGDLQRIHETWLHTLDCSRKYVEMKSDKLDLPAFTGLFGLFGLVALVGLLIHGIRKLWQEYKTLLLAAVPLQSPSRFRRGERFLRSFKAYVWRTGKSVSVSPSESGPPQVTHPGLMKRERAFA